VRPRGGTLIRFWQAWKRRRELVRLDAEMLIEKYGPVAYEVAWNMSRDVRDGELIDAGSDDHWEEVLAFIAAQGFKRKVDAGTDP
jgi:hypothetical protein